MKRYYSEIRFKQQIQNSKRYRDLKALALQRASYKCENEGCGSKKRLELEHIVPLQELLMKYNVTTIEQAEYTEALWKLDIVKILCHECHKKTETYGKKAEAYAN